MKRWVKVGGGRGGWWRLAAVLSLAAGCSSKPSTTLQQHSVAARYDPARDLGPLFQAVQLSGMFEDSKTFVDARPLIALSEISARYASSPGITVGGGNLRAFVEQHFELPRPVGEGFRTDPVRSMEEHIGALWPVLTRAADTADARSSLIPLPHAYVVPGGRFREVYYWDSYFTMLGLIE
ncbi:MAG: trehalase family glycosidase, partial [Gemmatimonadales bacterium]